MADDSMAERQMDKSELLTLTSRIVAAHVARNSVALNDLPNLIQQIFGALSGAGGEAPGTPERPQPAVPIKRSVTEEYIVCLEDGKRLKMLKRHLKTAYDMTPEQYRERWNLPADYPMVAPKYALARRELAKKIGLGTKRRKTRRG
jgi:predicted transcriptional regulator